MATYVTSDRSHTVRNVVYSATPASLGGPRRPSEHSYSRRGPAPTLDPDARSYLQSLSRLNPRGPCMATTDWERRGWQAVVLIAIRTYRLIFHPELLGGQYQIKPVE